MKKLSLLFATSILSATLYSAQAQAVTQTISWCFNSGGTCSTNSTINAGSPIASAFFLASGATESMTPAQKLINSFGGNYFNISPTSTFTSDIQADVNGLGINSNNNIQDPIPTQINAINPGQSLAATEFLGLDLTFPSSYTSAITGGHWEIDLYNPLFAPNERVELRGDTNSTLTGSINLITTALNAGITTISFTTTNSFLYILPNSTDPNLVTSFQLSQLRFVYDDGLCPTEGCPTAPEPSLIGLLGFSLFGLAFLRKR